VKINVTTIVTVVSQVTIIFILFICVNIFDVLNSVFIICTALMLQSWYGDEDNVVNGKKTIE